METAYILGAVLVVLIVAGLVWRLAASYAFVHPDRIYPLGPGKRVAKQFGLDTVK